MSWIFNLVDLIADFKHVLVDDGLDRLLSKQSPSSSPTHFSQKVSIWIVRAKHNETESYF